MTPRNAIIFTMVAALIAGAAMAFSATLQAAIPVAKSVNVLVEHNDGFNDGQDLHETILTPRIVASAKFGKIFAVHLAGAESGQPLYKAAVNITIGPHQGRQNVVFVALNNDSVWAVNADTGAVLWKTSLLTKFHNSADTVAAADGNRSTGRGYPLEDTPAIDPNNNVIYVQCEESETGPGTGGALHWIHLLTALNIANGTRYANTVNIAEGLANAHYISGPSVPRAGGGLDVFDVRDLTCRCLTFDPVNHMIYIAWADPGDGGPYNGWIVGYSAIRNESNNLPLKAQWCAVPTGNGTGSTRFSDGAGGIWQGGGAIAVDRHGILYVEIGNGTFETHLIKAPYSGRLSTDVPDLQVPSGGDYGDAVVKLAPDSDTRWHTDNPNGFGLHVSDYFTPKDEETLNQTDMDLGSSSPVLLPDSVGNAQHRHLMIINDKQGIIYLLDRDNMGGYHGDAAGRGKGTNDIVQAVYHATGRTFSTGAFFPTGTNRGMIYYAGIGSFARAFAISDAHIHPRPTSTSANSYGRYGYPGSTPSISANGRRDGILWTLDQGKNQLVAYNAVNLNDLLFRSDQLRSNAITGAIVHFNTPTIAAGRVYVGTSDALNVYGIIAPHDDRAR